MDYKQAIETIRWHSVYSKLNGAQARVIMNLIAEANYKTGTIAVSYTDLADAIGLSKVAIKQAIDALVKKQAIVVLNEASGRRAATYRVRSAEELNEYFMQDIVNPEHLKWEDQFITLGFEDLQDKLCEISDNCEECEEEGLCPQHKHKTQMFKSSREWRAYQLWLTDHPQPERIIKKVIMG